jgi:hypothetical protein
MKAIFACAFLGAAGWIAGYSAVISAYRHYLPHRPMSQVDIQGHQDKAPQHPCPAVYDAPQGNLDLCWGVVTQGVAGTTYSNDPTPSPPPLVYDNEVKP